MPELIEGLSMVGIVFTNAGEKLWNIVKKMCRNLYEVTTIIII